jgi:hypothetical protein
MTDPITGMPITQQPPMQPMQPNDPAPAKPPAVPLEVGKLCYHHYFDPYANADVVVPALCVELSADETTARVIFLGSVSGNVLTSELSAELPPEDPAA